MIKFNKQNVAKLLRELYYHSNGKHYPKWQDHLSIENIKGLEYGELFVRIYDSLSETKIDGDE